MSAISKGTILDFLTSLQSRDIRLWPEDGQLRFSAPAGALTSDIRRKIHERKAEILAFLSDNLSSHAHIPFEIKSVERGEILPLSFEQERLWFLDQLEPGNILYNIPFALRFIGVLDIQALEETLHHVIERHESLRTVIEEIEGKPVQRVLSALTLPLPLIDIRALSAESKEARAQQWMHEQTLHRFALQSGPLVQWSLLRLGMQEHLLVVVIQHIVFDGWSMRSFLQEVQQIYTASVQKQALALPALPLQYADYALWQRQWLQSGIEEQQLAYWKKQLAGIPELLDLPTTYLRPAIQQFEGKHYLRWLPQPIVDGLRNVGRREYTTLFMTLLAAFVVLLARYSGQDDIVVGTPVANRMRKELEPLIGFFVNTLVLRMQVQNEQFFRDLLHQVKERVLEAYAHQELPFGRLVEELKPDRSLSYSPLFQVSFGVQPWLGEEIALPEATMHLLEIIPDTAKFDLALMVYERNEGLFCAWEYNTSLFDEAAIVRFSRHFERLLASIVVNPQQAIGHLPLLSNEEQKLILQEWNATRRPYAKVRLHDMFEAQVEQTPDAIALVDDEGPVSYQELNRRSNQLAHYLQRHGVGPEVVVGICIDRSSAVIIALLAVLKAGGAFVYLAPSYPRQRLAFMIDDTHALLILTTQQLLEKLPLEQSARVICLDTKDQIFAGEPTTNPISMAGLETLFCVLYTSGSTGLPKGVMLSYKGMGNVIGELATFCKIEPEDRVLQYAVLSFDASISEIFMAFSRGATLLIVPEDTRISIADLVSYIQTSATTMALLSPSVLRLLPEKQLPLLRCLVSMGEACSLDIVRTWADNHLFFNGYGPTECSIGTTMQLCSSSDERIMLGHPISNVQMYVLDTYFQPLPIGVVGELYIGGVGVVRGYLGQPDLTAERFLPDPFSTESGAHLYRTGDLARTLPDGNFEYIGRSDFQVKLRGQRLELGEIERFLRQHEAVQDCVVVVHEDRSGEKLVVAYIIAAHAQEIKRERLQQHLQTFLPQYMLPNAFVMLERFPYTAHGKINRQALPLPDFSSAKHSEQEDNTNQASLTPVEEVLCAIWQHVLKVERVRLHDNFFALGGHSLLAAQLNVQIRKTFNIALPIRAIFEAPTVSLQAEYVEQAMKSGLQEDELPITRVDDNGNLPLSVMQQRLWFLNQLDPGNPVYNIPLALRFTGHLDTRALETTLNEIVRRHESLRTIFLEEKGNVKQFVTPTRPVRLPLIDLRAQRDNRAGEFAALQWMQTEAIFRFDLSQGPLLRYNLVCLDEQKYILFILVHHIIFDGWSIDIFLHEMQQLYSAFVQNLPSPLRELPIQYPDYAQWHQQWMQGEVERQLMAYWKEQLKSIPEVLNLPIDHPRPSVQRFAGAHYVQALPLQVVQGLKHIGRQEQTTLFMTLLAAFDVFLARVSGQNDIAVGTPIANRTRHETEPLIGLFVNTLVLRIQLNEGKSFGELLQQVREVALGAYAHQEVPFERLVDELQPARSLSYSPLFQVMFGVQKSIEQEIALPHVTVNPMEIASDVAKFDLMLMILERDEELVCAWEYNVDLFKEASIKRMHEQFVALLTGIVANPQQSIWRLPLLSDEAYKQIVHSWNATQQRYPAADLCLDALLAKQVEETPDAVSLVFEEQQLTYAALHRQADGYARMLRNIGVRPEILVGVCMERSLEMVVALLSILKAGGAYVPLDPEYPSERLCYVLNDIQAPVVLTQQRLREKVSDAQIQLLCLDSEDRPLIAQGRESILVSDRRDTLAYIIYTSGSTGKPKGVMNTHRAIVNRLLWMQDAYGLTATDRVLQKTPYSFDVSVWEFFWPLLTGATLVMALPSGHRDSDYIVHTIMEQGITTLHFVPSMLSIFLQEKHVECCQSLQRVICSGEALAIEQRQQFFARFHADLYNLYGPTEAAVDVTAWSCGHTDELSTVPIGRPIANIRIYVLDVYGQPVPVGTPGELHIGGIGLARGYLGRPELTAERFVPDPFSGELGTRLYRTGDLVRYHSNGVIEYIGRIDFQVKLRGQRIELGEIENVLRQHEVVQECAVSMVKDQHGEQRLVAYLVAKGKEEIHTVALHQFLLNVLPQYMIPALFMQLEQLPLGANGKLDRKALPLPDWQHSAIESSHVGPRTQLEENLVAIWSQVLDLKYAGIHDNFFVMGGDSIRALQVLSLMKRRGMQGTLQQLFQHQTIAELADVLQTAQFTSVTVPVTGPFDLITAEDRAKLPADVVDAYPLTATQGGMFYHLLLTVDYPIYQNVVSACVRGVIDEGALREALQLLVMRHDNLRTSFDLSRYSEPLQLVHKDAMPSLIIEDICALSEEEQEEAIEHLIQQEKTRFFDYTKPPLLRLHIYRRSNETFQLTITEFHPILDGWSYHLNLVELFHNHDALLRKEQLHTEPLLTSYRDYVALEQQVLQSEAHREFWVRKLSDSTFLQIPRLQQTMQSFSESQIQSYDLFISPQLTDRLKELARQNAFPLKSVLLTAHIKLLSILGGTTDVLTGLVSNGRLEIPGGEDVRGLFLLTIPLRVNIEHTTWLELVRRVFEEEQEVLPYRRYPLPALQEAMEGRTLFETAFNYMHFHSVAELVQNFALLGPTRSLEETNYTFQSGFMLSPDASHIDLKLHYNASIISEEQMRTIVSYYESIFLTMIEHPESKHSTLNVLSETEMCHMLSDWNATAADYPSHMRIHDLFEAQVERAPDTIALVFENEQLSYDELNQRANQLGHYLQAYGIGADVPVGICVRRSLAMMIGLLGTLKAGGAYLPLDPAHPTARLKNILDDAQPSIILTELELFDYVPFDEGKKLCLDRDWQLIAQEKDKRVSSKNSSSHLAYIMYTSGSTGTPKGVALCHRNVVNLFAAISTCPGQNEVGTWLAVTSIAFDISVIELFWTLISGYRVVIQPELNETLNAVLPLSEHSIPQEDTTIPAQIIQHSVTHMQCTPAFMKMILTLPTMNRAMQQLCVLMLGGEALPVSLLVQLRSLAATRLYNMYGPTETTIWSTAYAIEQIGQTVPIGFPLINTQTYVLDRELMPVPLAVAGELYIAGDGLARGYLNKPDITADRFVPDPWSEPGSRMYRTGDLARYRSDGCLEFLGRLDHQVKINGHRIELEEIEVLINRLTGIRTCIVLTREVKPGDKRIVAYVVPEEGYSFSATDILSALQPQLPAYMLPASIMFTDHLPLTVNGKLDRHALPTPIWAKQEADDRYEPPQSSIEETLVNIWSQVFTIERIGRHDNFYALGGDSILSVQIVGRAMQAGLPITIKQVLQYQTIAELSAAIEDSLVQEYK